MKNNKWKALGAALLLTGCSLTIMGLLNRQNDASNSKNIEDVTRSVYADYSIYDNVNDLVKDSAYVVEGQYTDFLSVWNIERMYTDPTKEDPNAYSEGRKYSFSVSRVLKGENLPKEIEITKTYSTQSTYCADDGEEIIFQMPAQHYVEPQIGETYLLFLYYSRENDVYYTIGEAGEIRRTADGLSEICSNLLNPPADLPEILTAYAEGESTIYRISFSREKMDSRQNSLSGIPWEELLDQVEAAAE